MSLKGYRISHNNYLKSAFDGEGARKFGGRWNSKGTAVLYISNTLSLAILEILVHLEDAKVLAENFSYIKIEFPGRICEAFDEALLPKKWYRDPPNSLTQKIGDKWVSSGKSAVLKVPSSVIPEEHNYILNPDHKDFSKISVSKSQKLFVDERIIKSLNK